MKILSIIIVLLASAGSLLAHPGHDAGLEGVAHYTLSAYHSIPIILGALAVAYIVVKRVRKKS